MDYVRPTVVEDIQYVADNMRVEDVREVEATGFSPIDALNLGFNRSDICLTMVGKEGTPAGLLGVAPSPMKYCGLIWLLGTPGIVSNTHAFLKHSKPVLTQLYDHTQYELLYNFTHSANKLHHRWLKWLGFRAINSIMVEPSHELFYEFARLRGS
jgi:hypothetical protein